MELIFTSQAEADREYWKQSGNLKIQKRISLLLEDILQHPFTGIGKPEPLKHDRHGRWSRRINKEHRIVYRVSGDKIYVYVFAMRYHYK